MKFRCVNVDAITFAGLTSPRLRRVFFRVQIGLGILMTGALLFNFRAIYQYGSNLLEVVGGLSLILITYLTLWPRRQLQLKRLLARYSLDSFFDARDARVIQQAYNEVFRMAKGVNFGDALKLREHEPALGEFIHLKIIVYQGKGLLRRWVIDRERLEQTCRFLYLCSVAEQRQDDHLAGRETTVF